MANFRHLIDESNNQLKQVILNIRINIEIYLILCFICFVFAFCINTYSINLIKIWYSDISQKNCSNFFWFLKVFFVLTLPLLVIKLRQFYLAKLQFGKSGPYFIFVLLLILGFCILTAPFLLTLSPPLFGIEFNGETGPIGDTVGGLTAPFIGFSTVIVTFLAFWVQFKANIYQSESINIDRFESKYLEMIRLHRDNVNELTVHIFEGRRVFVSLFNEFRYAYNIIDKFIKHLSEEDKTKYNLHNPLETSKTELAYLVFYLGVGYKTEQIVNHVLKDSFEQEFIHKLWDKFKEVQGYFTSNHTKRQQSEQGGRVLLIHAKFGSEVLDYYARYKPFVGHRQQLGHYFRHLFQTVAFVAKYDDHVIPKSKKYEYMKILRGQLSDYEQLLLYYNATTKLGSDWFNCSYISEYLIIKNMPLYYADFGALPQDVLKEEIEALEKIDKKMFEIDEWMKN